MSRRSWISWRRLADVAAGFFGGALVVEVDKALQDGLFEVFVAAGEAVGERESGTIRPGRVRLEGGPVEGIMTGTVMPLVGFEDDGIEVVVDLLEEVSLLLRPRLFAVVESLYVGSKHAQVIKGHKGSPSFYDSPQDHWVHPTNRKPMQHVGASD